LFAGLLPTLRFRPRRAGGDRHPSAAGPSRVPSGLGRWGMPSLALAAAVIAVGALLGLSLRLRQPVPIAGKRVGLFVTSSTPWERSAAAGYGGVTAATVGDLADLLAALGCPVRRVGGALDAKALQ